jgi:hypothetical protein
LEWRGIFDHINLWNSGVMGPLVNHCLIGWNRSSLRSVSVRDARHPPPHFVTHEQPKAYFCQRLSSSSQVRDTPSWKSPLLYVAHRTT